MPIIKKRVEKHEDLIHRIAHRLLKNAGIETDFDNRIFAGYKLYCCDTKRGWCYYNTKHITIPLWAVYARRGGYLTYYIAHELSHAIASNKFGDDYGLSYVYKPHGPEFMEIFMKVCPKSYQHYEIDYKPRNAKAAGITE